MGGRLPEAPRPGGTFRFRSVPPGAGSIAGSVGPTITPPQAAPRQWTWGQAVAAPTITMPTLEPQWAQYVQEARAAREIADQQAIPAAPPVDPMTPGGFDELVARRYASILERQRMQQAARNLPDPEFPINEF